MSLGCCGLPSGSRASLEGSVGILNSSISRLNRLCPALQVNSGTGVKNNLPNPYLLTIHDRNSIIFDTTQFLQSTHRSHKPNKYM
jgi:hypothetical protein